MLQNPSVVQLMARDRAHELRRHAQKTTVRRSGRDPRRIIAAARNATGWMLVDLGLRLTVPRTTMRHPVPRGQ